jgi:guanylate kinase
MSIEQPVGFKVHKESGGRKGRIFVVSGPSGVGKGTVIKRVIARTERLALSVSATTRDPRPGDTNGITYHFLSEEQFKQGISEGVFYEYALYKHKLYGTLKETVEKKTTAGIDLVLEIDIQGARSVKRLAPNAVLIYMQPPNFETLESRLRGRDTETEESIQERLAAAVTEQESIDTDYCGHYVITNDDIENCADALFAIVQAERHRLLCSGSPLARPEVETI